MQFEPNRAPLAAALLVAALAALPAWADDDCRGNESLRLVNGRIHTMDAKDAIVHEVLIKNGRFAGVGRDGLHDGGRCTRTINLRGRTAVPGIIDNHNHVVALGLRPGHDTRIENARTLAEVLATLAARAAEIPQGQWLTALGGFNTSQFAPPPPETARRLPTLAELDSVTPHHPVLIMQGFAGPTVTNSLGKKILSTKNVTVGDNGSIATNVQSTRALNALRQMQTLEEQNRGLGYAMTYAAEVGVTTHLDQGGFPNTGPKEGNNDVDQLAHFDQYRAYDSLRSMYQQGKVSNRIWINFLHLEEDPATPQLDARLKNVFNDFGDDMVKVVGIGEFTAGPFLGYPGTPQWLNGTKLVAEAGWRNENHTLNLPVPLFPPGPPDWRLIIDGWQAVHDQLVGEGKPGITKLRWVLAHVPVITQEYIDRLKSLGGGISLVGGWRYISGSPTANGPPFRRIVDSKIPSGMSSDGMQISPMNPWLGMYYAVTGINAAGVLINDGQQITRKEVLRLYTADNGWFLNAEDKLGSVELGKLADLIVLSDDYFDERRVSNEAIKDIHSVLTVIAGKVEHDNLDGRKRMYWNRESRRAAGFSN